jgi:hypothetical protein
MIVFYCVPGMPSLLSGSNFVRFPGCIRDPRPVRLALPLLVSQRTQHTTRMTLINLRDICLLGKTTRCFTSREGLLNRLAVPSFQDAAVCEEGQRDSF